eukprot:PhF_6_TR40667/c0_g1_i1/m.61088
MFLVLTIVIALMMTSPSYAEDGHQHDLPIEEGHNEAEGHGIYPDDVPMRYEPSPVETVHLYESVNEAGSFLQKEMEFCHCAPTGASFPVPPDSPSDVTRKMFYDAMAGIYSYVKKELEVCGCPAVMPDHKGLIGETSPLSGELKADINEADHHSQNVQDRLYDAIVKCCRQKGIIGENEQPDLPVGEENPNQPEGGEFEGHEEHHQDEGEGLPEISEEEARIADEAEIAAAEAEVAANSEGGEEGGAAAGEENQN